MDLSKNITTMINQLKYGTPNANYSTIEKTEKFNRIYYKYRAENMSHDTAMERAHKYMQKIIIAEIRNTVFKNK